jgi:predicted alpha/beta hydrolase family esterase
MKFVEENNISNSKIILVAPTYPNLAEELWTEILWDSFETIKKYYDIDLDFEKINSLNNNFTIFLSDNDPYINMEHAKKYYSKLENTKFVDFSWKGHFNKSAWVLELKEILEEV